MKKILYYYNNLQFSDFVRKVISFILCMFNILQIRRIKSFYFFKTSQIKLGHNIKIKGFPVHISVGKHTIIYDNCMFEIDSGAILKIGTNVILSYGVIVCCKLKIVIGNDVQIGEYTSIRDSTHTYSDLSKPMKYAKDKLAEIVIGDDVWIGRGSIIMPGTIIEDGVVIGANSVVKGVLKKNGIYAGIPVKFIKDRT